MIELPREYINTLQELHQVQLQLIEKKQNSLLKRKVKLAEKEKMYRKLSDIEVTLSKIECHTNEQLKLMRLQTELIYHSLKLGTRGGKYNDKAYEEWWKRFCRISD